jgi:hypothetical protein
MDEFQEGPSQIINVIIAEGVRDNLDVEIGHPNLKLCISCYSGKKFCFRTRVIIMANKYPGFLKFSKYKPISYMSPVAVVS